MDNLLSYPVVGIGWIGQRTETRERSVTTEREIKLIADIDTDLPDVSDCKHGLAAGEPTQLQLAAVYYDTPTFSLARSGVTLRARTGEDKPIWTLKLPGENGNGLSRAELEFDEPLGPIPAQVRLTARAYVRSQPLDPVVRLNTDRTEVALSLDGAPLAKLVDDRVEVEDGAEPVRRFREIEVELANEDADPKSIARVVDTLRDAGFRDEDPIPKAIRALGDRALDPPEVATVAVGRRSSTGTLVRAAISRSVAQLISHHAGVWLGEDEEAVHQFRVATRRLRSDLRTFAPLLDQHWMNWLRDELQWLGGEVGRARDSDVLAARLRRQMADLPADDSSGAARLAQRLDENSAEARQHVVAALGSDRYIGLLDALVAAARAPRFAADSGDIAERPARDVFVKLVRKSWHKLQKAADALTADSPDSAFHAARIRAKKARYAAEAVVPVYGREARQFAENVEGVQSVLGDHQDTAVAEAWLRKTANETPAVRLVVGELITIERLERLRLRKEFAATWKRASRPKVSAWLD
jgi:CHAD domain-containing protein